VYSWKQSYEVTQTLMCEEGNKLKVNMVCRKVN